MLGKLKSLARRIAGIKFDSSPLATRFIISAFTFFSRRYSPTHCSSRSALIFSTRTVRSIQSAAFSVQKQKYPLAFSSRAWWPRRPS